MSGNIEVCLTEADGLEIMSGCTRSCSSAKEFWYDKRNTILTRLHTLNLDELTEKQLLLANLEMNTKIYWELRKLNEITYV